jgi:hypothetical protein
LANDKDSEGTPEFFDLHVHLPLALLHPFTVA